MTQKDQGSHASPQHSAAHSLWESYVKDNPVGSPHNDPQEDIEEFLKSSNLVEYKLSVVELCFQVATTYLEGMPPEFLQCYKITCAQDEAIEELNIRFREHGIGYQFENGQIVRIDSEFAHAEIVKPTLLLLSDPRFAGLQEEYLAAHAHYRASEYGDAIVDANNAFESTLRTVSEIAGSPAGKGASASNLISHIRKLGLLPDYLESSFDQLAATLKSGLPAVRNNAGGHGQGPSPRQTPAYVAGYALHLCASNILFLAVAFKEFEAAGKQTSEE